jgi:ABC-type transport system involved in multi-copper enzyme maturation permease subunit
MNAIWHIAIYEWRMQYRSLTFWLVALVLCADLIGELLPQFQQNATYISSASPVIHHLGDGRTIDRTANARQALEVARFSLYSAWNFIDTIGVSSTLFIGFLSAFIWQRDRRWDLVDSINARPILTWQYVTGKYLGVTLSWSIILVGLMLIGAGRAYQIASQSSIPFAIHEFLFLILPVIGVSLLYGTALILLLSLLLRHSIGALLIYFFCWAYIIFDLGMLEQIGRLHQQADIMKFLTYWHFRSPLGFEPETLEILQSTQSIRWGNRVLYSVLTGVLLGLTIRFYQRSRTQGMQSRRAGPVDHQARPLWRRWLPRLK